MINPQRLYAWLFPDRRPDWEKARERDFIAAVNRLKTLSTRDRGGMAIDPEELREQIIASREQLKHLVHKPGAPSGLSKPVEDVLVGEKARLAVEAPASTMDCIEVVTWRRLQTGSAVRYVCLQSTSTGRFAVATASIFSGTMESLPTWVDGNINRQIANALRVGELHWYATVSEAMDAWYAEL